MLYCAYCGTPLEDGDLFCTGCGKPVANTEDVHMMPGREPVRQGSLDPTNPDSIPERHTGAGGLHYGENGNSGGMDDGDDRDPENNRIAVIIAGVAIAVIVCAFFLLLTGGLSRNDKDTKEEETAAYQEAGSEEEESVSGPDGSVQTGEEGENPDDGKASGQPAEETPAAEKEQTPASSDASDHEEDRTETVPAGDQPGEQPEQADLEKAADTPLQRQEGEEKDEAQKQTAEDKNKEDTSDRENMSGVDSAEKLREQPVAPAGTDGSYILADSDKRTYSREELSRLDDYSLQMAINELYARHGRRFKTQEVQQYFDGKSWYNGTISPEEFDGNEAAYFNNYEMKNRELMAKIREERAAAGSSQ